MLTLPVRRHPGSLHSKMGAKLRELEKRERERTGNVRFGSSLVEVVQYFPAFLKKELNLALARPVK